MRIFQLFQLRHTGGRIPTGLSWQWVGGPIVRFMPASRAWKFRLRLRIARYTDGQWFWMPGFCFELHDRVNNASFDMPDSQRLRWGFEWNQSTRRPRWHCGGCQHDRVL